MAGERDLNENNSLTAPNSTCNFNLARLRERVKEYIDKPGLTCESDNELFYCLSFGFVASAMAPTSFKMATRHHLKILKQRIPFKDSLHHYDSALFWADKLVSLSNGGMEDVYWYAQTLYSTGQYHRAANCIISRKLHKNHMCCRYLAAKCHYKCREYQEALAILDFVDPASIEPINKRMSFNINQSISEVETSYSNKSMESSMNLLRGQIYEAMDNRTIAAECFREALRLDVYCYEAFDLLVDHQMLSAQEESPDLNPIEMVWNQMKRFIAKQEPRTKEELMDIIETFWREKMTVSQCNRYIDHIFKVAPTVVVMGGKATGDIPKKLFPESSEGKSFKHYGDLLKSESVQEKIRQLCV